MRSKSLLLLIVALGCGAVASVAVSQVVLEKQSGGTEETVGLLVASKEIPTMTKLNPDSFRIEQFPQSKVPAGALTDLKQLEGKFCKQKLYPGEPIFEAKLSNKGRSYEAPEGYRIFDLNLQDGNGNQGYIGPGDRVDIKGFFEKGKLFNTSKSVTVMENIEVAMVDGVAFNDPEATNKAIRTVQLLVKDSQYEALDTAYNLSHGKLRIALRPPARESEAKPADTGESFLNILKESESSGARTGTSEDAAPVVSFEQPKQHDMIFHSGSGTTIYRWTEGKNTPTLIDASADPNASGSSFLPSGPLAPFSSGYPSPYTGAGASRGPAATSGGKPSNLTSNGLTPADPNSSSQSNMTWDPVKGVWQSGGFKASYPGSK